MEPSNEVFEDDDALELPSEPMRLNMGPSTRRCTGPSAWSSTSMARRS